MYHFWVFVLNLPVPVSQSKQLKMNTFGIVVFSVSRFTATLHYLSLCTTMVAGKSKLSQPYQWKSLTASSALTWLILQYTLLTLQPPFCYLNQNKQSREKSNSLLPDCRNWILYMPPNHIHWLRISLWQQWVSVYLKNRATFSLLTCASLTHPVLSCRILTVCSNWGMLVIFIWHRETTH